MDFKLFALLKKYIDKRVVDSGGLPAGGSIGQLLGKTQSGTDWIDPPSNVNPDYEQNDETAPDYIKNRPGGYYEIVYSEVVPETTITSFSVNESTGAYVTNTNITKFGVLGSGYTCRVEWNGETYTCVSIAGDYALGNKGIAYAGARDTGEPFFFTWNASYSKTNEPVTFRILEGALHAVLFNEEFIPDSVARVDQIPESLPSATAEDDGKSLKVIDGVWAKEADHFVANITVPDDYAGESGSVIACTSDKTASEIISAINDNKVLSFNLCRTNTAFTTTNRYTYALEMDAIFIDFFYPYTAFGMTVDIGYRVTFLNGDLNIHAMNIASAPELPEVTTSDAGKFLRVSADGSWVAESIPNAEEGTFG